MKLLALDVGESTGVASSIDGKYSTMTVHTMVEVWTVINNVNWDGIVYETYAAVQIGSPGLHTVQLIGGVRALCWLKNIKCMAQTPQARISYMKESKAVLHRRGIPCTKHEIDALAHLMLFEHALKINDKLANPQTQV